MRIFLTILFISFLSFQGLTCTIGVASGKATSDGRPLLWKTRDYEVKPNIVCFSETTNLNFVSGVTPEYGYDESWYGVNDKGFAIVNSFIADFPEGNNDLRNGDFMALALSRCSSVADFINLLDSTNVSGRSTRAIFGVIDTCGGAAMFEVNATKYWKYDANDKEVAPDGYIVRTNFAFCTSSTAGIERYNRSSKLIARYHNQGCLTIKSILQGQMRDLADTQGNDLTDEYDREYLDCRNNICKYPTISATIIQGVKENEVAKLTTMWSIIGNPFASVALPYWPVGKTPNVSSADAGASLYQVANNIKQHIFQSA